MKLESASLSFKPMLSNPSTQRAGVASPPKPIQQQTPVEDEKLLREVLEATKRSGIILSDLKISKTRTPHIAKKQQHLTLKPVTVSHTTQSSTGSPYENSHAVIFYQPDAYNLLKAEVTTLSDEPNNLKSVSHAFDTLTHQLKYTTSQYAEGVGSNIIHLKAHNPKDKAYRAFMIERGQLLANLTDDRTKAVPIATLPEGEPGVYINTSTELSSDYRPRVATIQQAKNIQNLSPYVYVPLSPNEAYSHFGGIHPNHPLRFYRSPMTTIADKLSRPDLFNDYATDAMVKAYDYSKNPSSNSSSSSKKMGKLANSKNPKEETFNTPPQKSTVERLIEKASNRFSKSASPSVEATTSVLPEVTAPPVKEPVVKKPIEQKPEAPSASSSFTRVTDDSLNVVSKPVSSTPKQIKPLESELATPLAKPSTVEVKLPDLTPVTMNFKPELLLNLKEASPEDQVNRVVQHLSAPALRTSPLIEEYYPLWNLPVAQRSTMPNVISTLSHPGASSLPVRIKSRITSYASTAKTMPEPQVQAKEAASVIEVLSKKTPTFAFTRITPTPTLTDAGVALSKPSTTVPPVFMNAHLRVENSAPQRIQSLLLAHGLESSQPVIPNLNALTAKVGMLAQPLDEAVVAKKELLLLPPAKLGVPNLKALFGQKIGMPTQLVNEVVPTNQETQKATPPPPEAKASHASNHGGSSASASASSVQPPEAAEVKKPLRDLPAWVYDKPKKAIMPEENFNSVIRGAGRFLRENPLVAAGSTLVGVGGLGIAQAMMD
jgi:hypothetical protein